MEDPRESGCRRPMRGRLIMSHLWTFNGLRIRARKAGLFIVWKAQCTITVAGQDNKPKSYKHGACGASWRDFTPEYRTWKSIKQRCLNPKNPGWKNYGGRGIKMCQRWLDSFSDFLKDLGTRPVGYSLERKDNNGDYCPANCVWANRTQQNRNARSNHAVSINGVTKLISEWSEETGVHRTTIFSRLKKGDMGLRLLRPPRWSR